MTLEVQIAQADEVIEQVAREHASRSELIELSDIVEEAPYRSLRTGLRDIDELAAKMKERGQLVPILVWLRRGKYVLLSGHRRTAALRALQATTVKAIVYGDRELCERDALNIAIDDNVDRNNFSKLELAALVHRLVTEGLTQRKVAKRLRLSNGTVSDYYRLHGAPPDVQAAVDQGRLAMRAGLRLQGEPEAVRRRVVESTETGMLSLGDVSRLLTGGPDAVRKQAKATARRGAAWSRETSVVGGLAWQRVRDSDREIRIRIPKDASEGQRHQLRKFLLDQVRGLQ